MKSIVDQVIKAFIKINFNMNWFFNRYYYHNITFYVF